MNEPKPQTNNRRVIRQVLLTAAIVFVFVAGVVAGIASENRRQTLDLSKFWTVYGLIKDNYVGDINKSNAAEGAVSGLVASLKDPYSAYLPPEDKKSLDDELSGTFQGIGAELTDKDGAVVVVAPIAGSPAEKAGIKPHDIITAVDGTTTDGLTLNQVVAKIRGPKGSSVKLTLLRAPSTKPLEMTITREDILVKSVTSKMIGTVGYINISQFGSDTVTLAEQAVKDVIAKKPTALILDLRNNPGGYLNDVPPIAGLFLTPSTIVKEKYRLGKEDELKSTAVPLMPGTPIFVLVNGGSASAAEILAGALQDYNRAKLIGVKTFGKGSVQNVIDLPDGSALRITIAEWLTPKDRAINKVGITPDIVSEGEKNLTTGADPVLDKALELAKQL